MMTRILIVLAVLFFVVGCKQTQFQSGTSKRISGTKLLGGEEKEVSPDTSVDKVDEPGIDVVDEGVIDPTPTETADVKDGGKGEYGDDDDDDDNDSGGVVVVDDGKVASGTKLLITGHRLDSDDTPVQLIISSSKGYSHTVDWPAAGATVELEGVCTEATVVIRVQTVLRGIIYSAPNPYCFIGRSDGDQALYIGFEHDCDSTNFNRIDDAIAHFSCESSSLIVEGLNMQNSIDLGQWID